MRHLKPFNESEYSDFDDDHEPSIEAEIEVKEQDKVFKLIGISAEGFKYNPSISALDKENTFTLRTPKFDVSGGTFALLYKDRNPRDLWICDLYWGGFDVQEEMKEKGYWSHFIYDEDSEPTEDWKYNEDGLEGFLSNLWKDDVPGINKEECFGGEKDYPLGIHPVVPDVKEIEFPDDSTKFCCKIETQEFADAIREILIHLIVTGRSFPSSKAVLISKLNNPIFRHLLNQGKYSKSDIDSMKKMLNALTKVFPG